MKRLLLVGFVMGFSFLSLADVPLEVTKKNRGLFGYKQVTEIYGEGRHTLSCFDPGHTSCRTNGLVVLSETVSLSSDEQLLIDKTVEDNVKGGSVSGKFVFDNKCLVVYTYDPDTDLLHYMVYTIAQAQSLNLI
jgi:hypothetical protein